jgi:hypothetical protein
MNGLRNLLIAVVVLAVVFAILGAMLASVLLAAAVLLPLAGLGWLAARLRVARVLWRSGGRLPMGDVVRVIGAARARLLALTEGGRGLAGLLLGLSAPALWAGRDLAALGLAGIGLAGLAATGVAAGRLVAGAKPVDVLPPE